MNPKHFLEELLGAAIAAAQPGACLPAHLPVAPRGRLIVVGAGKASAEMARVLEEHWQAPLEGLIVTRHGYGAACKRIEVIEASHPIPDSVGMHAAQRMLERVSTLSADDLVLGLFSGGGSALLPLPLEGLSLASEQTLSGALLRCGARIAEINCVRRHVSRIKGGRLAARAYPARVHALLISDVPGDRPLDIASGPTIGDPSTCADALAVLQRYALTIDPAILEVLQSGRGESVKPGDTRLARSTHTLIAAPQSSLEAAARRAREAGIPAHILGDAIEGEAREVALAHADIARQVLQRGQPLPAPCVLLSGGETTVRVCGSGSGGRNAEFMLALALALEGRAGIHALAADTDGVDGQAEIAGAFVGPDSLRRAAERGLRAADFLANNDTHGFFAQLGDCIVTGPTRTNVNDFRAMLIAP